MGLALFLLICVVIMFLLLPEILYPKKDTRKLPVYHHPVKDKSTTVIKDDVPANKVVIPPEDNAF